MENSIKNLILDGKTFNDIYHSLETTKAMINNVFKNIDRHVRFYCGWNTPRTALEKAVFSLHKKYTYYKDVNIFDSTFTFDYVVFEDSVPKLAILYLGPDYIVSDAKPVCNKIAYTANIMLLNEKEKFCETKNIPLLIFPLLEIFDNPFLASDMRKALEDCNYAKKHNDEATEEYLDASALYACSYDNRKDVKASNICGCYNCGTVIKSEDIKVFGHDDGALCPICKSFSIIAESQGFNIDNEFIETLKERYNQCG